MASLLSESSEIVLHNNVVADFNTLMEAAQQGVRHVVLTSSTSIYGLSKNQRQRSAAVWVDEERPPDPEDAYDISKLTAENLLRQLCAERGLSGTVFRCTRFFPDAEPAFSLRKLSRGVDVRDVAEAIACAACGPPRHDAQAHIFNLSASSPFRPADCGSLMTDAPAVLEQYFPGIRRIFGARGVPLPQRIDRVFDISRLRRALGFSPRHNFDEYSSAATRQVEG